MRVRVMKIFQRLFDSRSDPPDAAYDRPYDALCQHWAVPQDGWGHRPGPSSFSAGASGPPNPPGRRRSRHSSPYAALRHSTPTHRYMSWCGPARSATSQSAGARYISRDALNEFIEMHTHTGTRDASNHTPWHNRAYWLA